MRAARPETIRVKLAGSGKTVTLPYRRAVQMLSVGTATKAGKKPGPRPKKDAPSEDLSTTASIAGQDGEETENMPSSEVTDDGTAD